MTTNKKTLLIVESMAPGGWALFRERDDIAAIEFPNTISKADFNVLLRAHAPVNGVALGGTGFGTDELVSSGDMRVVGRIGVGYDAVDVAALSARGIPLMTAGTANSPSVAEAALFMMLALAKRAAELDALVKSGNWNRRLGAIPFDLLGKTALVVGFGRIGTRLVKRLLAMEMRVVVYDPFKSRAEIEAAGAAHAADLDAALPSADVVSLHCPKTPQTIGLIGAAQLRAMKPTAYLINTARGPIVDQPALEAALRSGHLAGAGLDVFDPEPPDFASALFARDLPNTVVTPHMAASTHEALATMARTAAEDIARVLLGQPPRYPVNDPLPRRG